MRDNRRACAEAVFASGLAVECALKAYIMHKERLNRWPERNERPELYSHSIDELRRIAGIIIDHREPSAPSWAMMTQWNRNQDYTPGRMPRKVARSWVEAAFGAKGVVTWIRKNLV